MYENERKELIDSIRRKGIKDESVLEAMMNVERHLFLPEVMHHHAYLDTALPIGYGQTISQPYTVAYMTEALKLKKGGKVLEIGTGSGYQAAILYEMGMKVYSIERNVGIYNSALKIFDKLGVRVATRCADGTIGWEEFAPYEGIIVTAGSPKVPAELKKQLAVNGRMIIPVGDRRTQILHIIEKIDENEFETEKAPYFAFVPLIGRDGWKEK